MRNTITILILLISCALKAQGVICNSFQLEKGKKYVLSAWVKEGEDEQLMTYEDGKIELSFKNIEGTVISSGTVVFEAEGNIIDGWQRIEEYFDVPLNAASINVSLKNEGSRNVYFDDIRVFPYDGNMKSYVYNQYTQRLEAELDENNYATFYEYDQEGGLIRIKKETERGVFTIQESRSGNTIIP
uniref:hypothetical protein n=1 Tax=Aureivirga marina TaxID=1182451 RepID=UPI0018CAC8A2